MIDWTGPFASTLIRFSGIYSILVSERIFKNLNDGSEMYFNN